MSSSNSAPSLSARSESFRRTSIVSEIEASSDGNGYEVAKRLREANTRSPRLVALSGHGDNQSRQQARDAGFDD
jgi:CheY-like chemotaxis protein